MGRLCFSAMISIGFVLLGCGGGNDVPEGGEPGDSSSRYFIDTLTVHILVDASDVDIYGTDTVYIGITKNRYNITEGDTIRFILADIDDWAGGDMPGDTIIDPNGSDSLDNLNAIFPESSDVLVDQNGMASEQFIVAKEYYGHNWSYHPGDNWVLCPKLLNPPITLDTITVTLWKRIWVEFDYWNYPLSNACFEHANRVFRGLPSDTSFGDPADSFEHRIYVRFDTTTSGQTILKQQTGWLDTANVKFVAGDSLEHVCKYLMNRYWGDKSSHVFYMVTTSYKYDSTLAPMDVVYGEVYDANYPSKQRMVILYWETIKDAAPINTDAFAGGVLAHEAGHHLAFIKHPPADTHNTDCIMEPSADPLLNRFCAWCVRRFRRDRERGPAIFNVGPFEGAKQENVLW